MTLHAFSVSDCYAESSTPRPCVTDVGDAGPWIAHRTVARAILLARFVWRHLYGLCNKMPNTSILWECILQRNGRPLRWNEWLRLQRLAPGSSITRSSWVAFPIYCHRHSGRVRPYYVSEQRSSSQTFCDYGETCHINEQSACHGPLLRSSKR